MSFSARKKEGEHLPLSEVQPWEPLRGSLDSPAICTSLGSVGLLMHLPLWLLCVSSQPDPCVVATKTELHDIACSGIETAANTSQKTLYLVTSQPVF